MRVGFSHFGWWIGKSEPRKKNIDRTRRRDIRDHESDEIPKHQWETFGAVDWKRIGGFLLRMVQTSYSCVTNIFIVVNSFGII